MKYILLLLVAASFWSCGETVQQDTDWQAKLDSMSRKPSVFRSKFVKFDGHFYEKNFKFTVSDTTLTIEDGNCPIVYTLYNNGLNGATTYSNWFSDNYVRTVSIRVMRSEGDKKIKSVQLNNHLFTNEPYVPEASVPETDKEVYVVVKGDTPTKVSKKLNIPLTQLPKVLRVGQKISY
jgi:LysM repeat protein